MARKVVTEDRVRWAVNTFIPYKAPGLDCIYTICLQKGLDLIIKYLIKVYGGSVAMGHIPKPWRDVRVVLIPKPNREPSLVKSYRSINLSSFMLKPLKRLMDKFLWEGALTRHPLEEVQLETSREGCLPSPTSFTCRHFRKFHRRFSHKKNKKRRGKTGEKT